MFQLNYYCLFLNQVDLLSNLDSSAFIPQLDMEKFDIDPFMTQEND